MPIFVKMYAKYREKGLIFVGVAIDQPAKVVAFANELGVNYPLLIGSLVSIEQTKAVGNRVAALPFTLVFDRDGRLVTSHLGAISDSQLEAIVVPLLQ
jgi:peroxiredoxin